MSTEDRLAGSLATPNVQMTHTSLPDQGAFIGLVLTVTVAGLITWGIFYQLQIAQGQTKKKSSREEGMIRHGV